MAEQQKWNLDRRVTAMMIEDMMFNPILAAKVIMGIELPPHQELRVMTMWTKSFTIDDSGFSTGKTFNLSLVAALRSVMFRDRISGMISKTYAQGKIMFRYFDNWANNNPRFRNAIRMRQGKIQIVHGSDVHFIDFRGGAQIRVLPPDFMKDSERLRGERWHDGYFDEWTTFGNMRALNKTVIGRVTNVNDYPDCPVRQNHIHMGSTPNFTHHPSYGLVKKIQKQIRAGHTDYARFTSNYRHIPKTSRFNRLVNRKTIFLMQTNLPKNMVKTEVDGLWQKDSGTYYSSAVVNAAQYPGDPKNILCLKRKQPRDVYIGAVDIAPGGVERAGKSDDCALTILRVQPDYTVHQAMTLRYNALRDYQFSAIVHKYKKLFNLSMIGYDPGGGGLYMRDRLRETRQMIDNKVVDCEPLIELDDDSGLQGDRCLLRMSRGEAAIKRLWSGDQIRGESGLPTKMHAEFAAALELGKLTIAPFWNGWGGNDSHWDCDNKRKYLNSNNKLTQEERVLAEMDLSVHQLMLIDTSRDTEGNPVQDKHGNYKFGSKSKKDSAYSLIYAYTTFLVWKFLAENGFVNAFEDEDEDEDACAAGVI
jgi:hypothetical protein